MKLTIRFALTFVLVFNAVAVQAAAGLKVTLEVIPAEALPGVPVALRATITNQSGTVYEPDGQDVALIVTPSAGDSFVASWYGNKLSIGADSWVAGPLRPGETAVASREPTGSIIEELWLDDTRLNEPGHYQLQLAFGRLRGLTLYSAQLPADTVLSSNAALFVKSPSGADKTVWEEMNSFLQKPWRPYLAGTSEGRELASKIVSLYPESGYAGWFAAVGVSDDYAAAADVLRTWLERAAPDAYTASRYLALAFFEEFAARQRPVDRADRAKHMAAARAAVDIATRSKNEKIIERGRDRLKSISELDDLP